MPIEIDSACSYSYEHKRFVDIEPRTTPISSKLFSSVHRIFHNLNPNVRSRLPRPHPDLFLAISLVLLFILSPVAGSSLGLVAPDEVDVSGEGSYKMEFVSSTDASGLSALFQIPEGFSYSGNSSIILEGKASSFEPAQSGQSLSWDLDAALRSCRSVVINEWEQNPTGTDTGKEWVELYNPASQAVNIGGWKLVDGYSGKSLKIAAGTVIVSGGYLVFPWTNGTLINSYLDHIVLIDSSGREVDRTPVAKDEKNNNLCQARYPNGKDLGSDLDWKFQASTPGSSNGGIAACIYAGESLTLSFNLTPGCSAPRQAALSGEIHSSGSIISAPSLPLTVRRANLSLTATPDRFDVAKGDVIDWTVLLVNSGDGTAYGASFNATLDKSLQLKSLDSTASGIVQNCTTLAPGAEVQIRLKARVVSSAGDYSAVFNACWGTGPCQEVRTVSELGARTAIRKQPDNIRSLAIGEVADYEVEADLPKGAHDFWINDTIPRGLIYNQSSLSLHGSAPLQEVQTPNSDGSLEVCHLFGDAGQGQTITITYNCRLENAPECQDGVVLPGTKASTSWMDGKGRKNDSDEAGALVVVEPELMLEMQTSRPVAAMEDRISYLLSVCHSQESHASAYDVDLENLLPEGLTYEPGSLDVLSGPVSTTSDRGQGPQWHFDSIDPGWNSSRKILLRFNATSRSSPGAEIVSHARITWTSLAGMSPGERTGDGGLNDYLQSALASVNVMSLSIRKSAEPDPVEVGEPLSYTLIYEDVGNKAAHNITIRDELDPRVTFLSADPVPYDVKANAKTNSDSITWRIPELAPDGLHSIAIKVHVSGTLQDRVLLQNRFSIDCDEIGPKSGMIYTPVQNGTRLDVNKTALQKAVRRGEEINYVIKVCNRGGRPATNVTVRDVFDTTVEHILAMPAPAADGIWRFESIAPGECVEIDLTVRVPRTDVKYESHQTVRGLGFVRKYQDYTTSRAPSLITNRVYVTSDQMQLSAAAGVSVLAEDGTDLSLREHGSGEYKNQEDLRFLTANKSIKLDRSLHTSYYPATILLPGNRDCIISSLWHEDTRAKNGITDTTFRESYRYSTGLDDVSHFDLDKNQSTMDIKSSFQGLAHMGTQKKSLTPAGRSGDISLVVEYAGAFQVSESIRDLGQGLIADRSISGNGYVAKDARVQDRQRSYESGTGAYRSDERMETFSNFMAKDLNVSYCSLSYEVAPRTFVNLTQKWSEGMWSRTPTSFIGEAYSSASRLKKEATAASLKELESKSSFSGRADLRTVYGRNHGLNRSRQVDQDETLIGDYKVERKIAITKAPGFDEPHLYLCKDGRLINDVAVYTITITNDGNAALGPIFLQDLFPAGARFINSTLRPVQIGKNSSNWTLVHLAIGDSIRIGIDLNIKKCQGNIVNLASVVGNYSTGSVSAQNLSVIDRAWLGGCVPAEEPVQPVSSCACLQEDEVASISNETEYFDPVQSPWAEVGEGSCPLNCPVIEDAPSSIDG